MQRSRKAAHHRVLAAHTLHEGHDLSGRCKLHILELSQNLVPRLRVEHLRYIGAPDMLNEQVHETPVAHSCPKQQVHAYVLCCVCVCVCVSVCLCVFR